MNKKKLGKNLNRDPRRVAEPISDRRHLKAGNVTGVSDTGSQRRGKSANQTRMETAGDFTTLSAKSRSELLEMAKALDLPGRSRMSKEELATALGRQ